MIDLENVLVVENFSDDIEEVVLNASQAPYSDLIFAGSKFPSLSVGMSAWAYEKFSKLLDRPVEPCFDYYRKYFKDSEQPSFIHEDSKLSEMTAVLSLQDDNGSLCFWEPREELTDNQDFLSDKKWNLIKEVPLKRNTCVIYQANLYHSRWPKDWLADNPRWVQVFFFN